MDLIGKLQHLWVNLNSCNLVILEDLRLRLLALLLHLASVLLLLLLLLHQMSRCVYLSLHLRLLINSIA